MNNIRELLGNAIDDNDVDMVKKIHKEHDITKIWSEDDIQHCFANLCHLRQVDIIMFFCEQMLIKKNSHLLPTIIDYIFEKLESKFHDEYKSILYFIQMNLSLDKLYFSDKLLQIFACRKGRLSGVKYLHTEIGLTIEDFRAKKNMAVDLACKNGHLDVVKYLHKEIKLTIEDFKEIYNNSREYLCKSGDIKILNYLREEVGLDI